MSEKNIKPVFLLASRMLRDFGDSFFYSTELVKVDPRAGLACKFSIPPQTH
jgi:hypothetical protein